MAVKDEYVFPRDHLDNNRINVQHYLWTRMYGYVLHPDIPTTSPTLNIADVGTGTGIWLLDLCDQLPPSVQLDGLDISFQAAPVKERLPPNMALRHWDIRTDPPKELLGVYDIVHIRLFSWVLLADELPAVADRLFKLLKPGGFLQWTEADFGSRRTVKTSPANKSDATDQLWKLMERDDERIRPKWAPTIPALLRDQGLENIKADVRDTPPHLLGPVQDCILLSAETIIRSGLFDDSVANKLKHLLAEAVKEARQGTCWEFTRWTIVGQKPAAA